MPFTCKIFFGLNSFSFCGTNPVGTNQKYFQRHPKQQQFPLSIHFKTFCMISLNVFALVKSPFIFMGFLSKKPFSLSFILQWRVESHHHFLYALIKPLYAKRVWL